MRGPSPEGEAVRLRVTPEKKHIHITYHTDTSPGLVKLGVCHQYHQLCPMAIDVYILSCVYVLYDNPLDKYRKHITKTHIKSGAQKLKASSHHDKPYS